MSSYKSMWHDYWVQTHPPASDYHGDPSMFARPAEQLNSNELRRILAARHRRRRSMGVKRSLAKSLPPMATVPSPSLPTPLPQSLSSSSSSGDGAYDKNPLASDGDDSLGSAPDVRTYSSYPYDLYGRDGSSASAASSSDSRDDNGTITALDLLPKELRKVANKTRPDSDIPWTSNDETCYYHKMDSDRCFHPRSCRECLDMAGCMINQLGQCVNQVYDGYNAYMDFRGAITRNMSGPHATNRIAIHTQQYHFPAKVVPYCPVDEPTCNYCKRNDFKTKIDSRFCLGHTNGRKCVCVSICENAVRNEVLVHVNCTNPLSSNTLANEIAHPLMSTPSLFTVIVAPILILLVTYRVVKRHQRSRTGSDDTVVGAPRSGDADGDGDAADSVWSWSTATNAQENQQPERLHPTGRLDLFGWQAQRQEMIAKEQLLLAAMEENSPASRFVDFDDTESSAPDTDAFTPSSAPSEGSSMRNASAPADSTSFFDDDSMPSARARGTEYQTMMDHAYWSESELAML